MCRLVLHLFGWLLSTMDGLSGILVIAHSISSGTLIRHRISFSRSDRMDDRLKLHTWHRVPFSHLFFICRHSEHKVVIGKEVFHVLLHHYLPRFREIFPLA